VGLRAGLDAVAQRKFPAPPGIETRTPIVQPVTGVNLPLIFNTRHN